MDHRANILNLAAELDALDYFELLQLEPTANDIDTRRAYYRAKRAFHPDRFVLSTDDQLTAAINRIAGRLTEAYTTLSDATRRKHYAERIEGPDRAKYLRFDAEQEEALREQAKKSICTTEKGLAYYNQGLGHINRARYADAITAFQTALMYEPGNPNLEAALADAKTRQRG